MQGKKFISPGAWFSMNYPSDWNEFEDGEGSFLFYNPDVWTGNFRISAFKGNATYGRDAVRQELKENESASLVKVGALESAYSKEMFQEEGNYYTSHLWITGIGNIAFECSFTVPKGGSVKEAEEVIATLEIRKEHQAGNPLQIAVAASQHLKGTDHAVLHINEHPLRADALGLIVDYHAFLFLLGVRNRSQGIISHPTAKGNVPPPSWHRRDLGYCGGSILLLLHRALPFFSRRPVGGILEPVRFKSEVHHMSHASVHALLRRVIVPHEHKIGDFQRIDGTLPKDTGGMDGQERVLLLAVLVPINLNAIVRVKMTGDSGPVPQSGIDPPVGLLLSLGIQLCQIPLIVRQDQVHGHG